MSDVTELLASLFTASDRPLPCEEDLRAPGNVRLLDSDGNGRLMITDAIHLLGFIFQRGTPPALGVECLPVAGCPERCSE